MGDGLFGSLDPWENEVLFLLVFFLPFGGLVGLGFHFYLLAVFRSFFLPLKI